ncbi:acyltransferase [Vibrio owensii]|uniref:acyltransferase n=1 Tax=Vibrio owensii TaxID=696485 RepID=UPI000EFB7316|nr:acyltransferase [Vibrio owensii]AYO21201.1 acyltransferase [Vibrio owensii]
MIHKLCLLYAWFVWCTTFFIPDTALTMRFRGKLYSFVMKNAGKNFQVSNGARLYGLPNISVGDDVYIATNVVLNAGSDIMLDSQVMIGIGAILVSGNHTYKNGSYRFGKMSRNLIHIGFGSWVSANVTITSGAIIPKGSLIAANSVVHKQLEVSGIYGGVPVKMIKEN